MNVKWNIPFNSVYLTSILTGLLCLINLGSTLAFNIIVSLSLLGLLSTYMISIGCVLLRRIRGQELPPARWSLGRLGLPVNAFAFFYSAFVIVFSCFPVTVPVDLSSANWAPVVWAGVIAVSFGVYYCMAGEFTLHQWTSLKDGSKRVLGYSPHSVLYDLAALAYWDENCASGNSGMACFGTMSIDIFTSACHCIGQ